MAASTPVCHFISTGFYRPLLWRFFVLTAQTPYTAQRSSRFLIRTVFPFQYLHLLQRFVMAEKAVVIYSGGMDSFTILNRAYKEGYDLYALTFDYGQKHRKEIAFASDVCQQLDINHRIIDITAINQLLQSSSL